MLKTAKNLPFNIIILHKKAGLVNIEFVILGIFFGNI